MRETVELCEPTDKQLSYAWKIIDKMGWDEEIKFAPYAPNNPDMFAKCAMYWIDTHKNGEITNNYDGFIKRHLFDTPEDIQRKKEWRESREWSSQSLIDRK